MREPPDWHAIRAAYDRVASRYDALHSDSRTEKRFDIIDSPQLAIARRGRVLELGCGTGRLLARVGSSTKVGIDLSVPMLARARMRGLTAICADAEALPFAAGSFDALIAGKGTFRYLHYHRAFAECARVLAPLGRLAVHQYAAATWSPGRSRNGPDRWAGQGRASLHVRRLHELYKPAREQGFIVEQTYLWRPIRIWPYAISIPLWMPGTLWSHCVVLFRKPGPIDGSVHAGNPVNNGARYGD